MKKTSLFQVELQKMIEKRRKSLEKSIFSLTPLN